MISVFLNKNCIPLCYFFIYVFELLRIRCTYDNVHRDASTCTCMTKWGNISQDAVSLLSWFLPLYTRALHLYICISGRKFVKVWMNSYTWRLCTYNRESMRIAYLILIGPTSLLHGHSQLEALNFTWRKGLREICCKEWSQIIDTQKLRPCIYSCSL